MQNPFKKLSILIFVVASFLFLSPTQALADCRSDCRAQGNTPGECNALCSAGPGEIFGTVNPPAGLEGRGLLEGGLTSFINSLLGLIIVGAGLFALFNLVTAGYGFMSAGDDPKKVAAAWQKIWMTLVGITFTAGAFVLAALIGQLVFGDPTALVKFRLFGVGTQ